MYDVHPIVVHFPIALLFLYSLIQIVPIRRWLPSFAWEHVSLFLLVFGFIGTIVASGTGELAAELNSPNHDILELHELFASITQVAYGVIIGSALVSFFLDRYDRLARYRVVRVVAAVTNFVQKRWVTVVLSVLGLIALVITGVLGGAMVYGASADPLATPLLQLFGVSL